MAERLRRPRSPRRCSRPRASGSSTPPVGLSERPDAAAVLGLGGTQSDLVALNARVRTAPDRARRCRLHRGALRRARIRDAVQRGEAARDRPGRDHQLGLRARPPRRPHPPPTGCPATSPCPARGPVAGLWRECMGAAVEEAAGTGLPVDLRSTMYAAFWRPPATSPIRVATVRVLHEHNGTRKVVSHFNKATKGRIVRDLLEHGANPRTPQALATALGDLGWHVETGETTPRGTQLDVVVREV
ncbi:peroxide stress protein YaaA [Nocardioides sp. B-3]|nr:peroxide stress protein YaaA [Nocardioides sp. B-3]